MNFYTLEWIETLIKDYLQTDDFFIEEKRVSFEPKIFALALLHIYQRKELPEKFLTTFLPLEEEEINRERGEFDFLYLIDLLRKEFAFWFRENVLSRDFTNESYEKLAHEFLMLEEQVRKQIQIPLLDNLKKLCMDLEEKIEKSETLDQKEEKRFFRLVNFFIRVEKLQPSKCSELVERAKNSIEKAYPEKLSLFEIPIKTPPEEFKDKFKEELMKVKVHLD